MSVDISEATYSFITGAQKERGEMAENILTQREEINVIVTTYDMAASKEDNKFMRRLRPDVGFVRWKFWQLLMSNRCVFMMRVIC
jgi:hypothetical protein